MSIAEEQDLALEYDISFAVHTSVSLMDREGVWGARGEGEGGRPHSSQPCSPNMNNCLIARRLMAVMEGWVPTFNRAH